MPIRSYAAAAGGNSNAKSNGNAPTSSHEIRPPNIINDRNHANDRPQQRQSSPSRSRSPTQQPRTRNEDEAFYILTLQTDQAHHKRMTALRNTYFPRYLNKLHAHLTLFHALPGSLLESAIIPEIQRLASQTPKFKVVAIKPFKLKKGVAISVPMTKGGDEARHIHDTLQRAWMQGDFLSEQDRGGMRLHYTIMNKVDDEVTVQRAFEEVRTGFKADEGTAVGLGLWRYEKGGAWKWKRGFDFAEGAQTTET